MKMGLNLVAFPLTFFCSYRLVLSDDVGPPGNRILARKFQEQGARSLWSSRD